MAREHLVRCRFGRSAPGNEARDLVLEIDGKEHGLTLRIDELARGLVQDIPDVLADLVEVAGFVYAADSVIRRGGPTDRSMGELWRRRMNFQIPVRCPDTWNSADVREVLADTLGFLSDDVYSFEFEANTDPTKISSYLRFGADTGLRPTDVILFSGGLDSFAGALDELVSRKGSVVLVSHKSATKLAPVQRNLAKALRKIAGRNRVLHIPVTAQLRHGSNRERTHRTRSFFFAALGMATARMFGLDGISFYENGIVSLNLPPVGQVVGARATRTTHPQSIAGFEHLFSALFERPIRVRNPFFLKTKREVVEVIRQHDATGLIRDTRSCAHVHDITRAQTHCGRCSQCIDRRFAMMAAGLTHEDPVEAYATDVLRDALSDHRDREMALAYVRHARILRSISPNDFLARFGEVNRALKHFDEPPATTLRRILELHHRHGSEVTGALEPVLRKIAAGLTTEDYAPGCLARLAGQDLFATGEVSVAPSSLSVTTSTATPAATRTDPARKIIVRWHQNAADPSVEIDDLGRISGATAEVLATLAESYLQAAGQGKASEDYPLIGPSVLAIAWKLDGDEPVRKRIARARSLLARRARDAGWGDLDRNAIIENIPWLGYRLNPTELKVLVI